MIMEDEEREIYDKNIAREGMLPPEEKMINVDLRERTPLEVVALRNDFVDEQKNELQSKKWSKRRKWMTNSLTIKKTRNIKLELADTFARLLDSTYSETEDGINLRVIDKLAMSCIERGILTGDIKQVQGIINLMDNATKDVFDNEATNGDKKKEDEKEVKEAEVVALDTLAHNGVIKNEY